MITINELRKDGMLLKEIPKMKQTGKKCRIAIEQNPLALRFASIRHLDSELCMTAVEKDGHAFRYVPAKFVTAKMCELAIEAEAALLKKVPTRFRTSKICINAIEKDVSTLEHVPEEERYGLFGDNTEISLIEKIVAHNSRWLEYMPNRPDVRALCIRYMEDDFVVALFMPKQIKMSADILDYQKSKGRLRFIHKYYDSEENIFKIKLEVTCNRKISESDEDDASNHLYYITVWFTDFDSFYGFLDGNLFDAELENYSFSGIDLARYNIKGAVISSEILQSQGLYDGTYFSMIKNHLDNNMDNVIGANEIAIPDGFCYPKPVDDIYEADTHITFFYISDIHLTHQVSNKFNDKATKEEVHSYLKHLARSMISSVGEIPCNSYLLIAGDTSAIFEFEIIFYTELVKVYPSSHIIVVPGNHELWDPWVDIDENLTVHRKFFTDLGITFLQNDLMLLSNWEKHEIIREAEISEISEEELRKRAQHCPVSIWGGLGFSGLNEEFNASKIQYGKSFDALPRNAALQKDIQETSRSNAIYQKVLRSLGKNRVVVLTHTNKEDWNADDYNPYWIYVNGHSHHNFFDVSDKRIIYADNQIGYQTKNIGLKYFYCDNDYDIFAYLQDGIHKITREQYIDFNRSKLVHITFRREYGTIYMIKRNSLYMFLIYCKYSHRSNDAQLWLMNGGKLMKLKRNSLDDLSYYYEHIEEYVKSVNKLLHKYSGGQQKLSEFVKLLGGSGTVHGCIIDVDKPKQFSGISYCHLFINPIDGKVTPYFANDVTSRYVYRDFKTLLQKRKECSLMAENYLNLEQESQQKIPSAQYFEPPGGWEHVTSMRNEDYMYDEGGYIYKISRIIKSLQYCVEKNIVRLWNERLLNYEIVSQIEQANRIEEIADDRLIMDEQAF